MSQHFCRSLYADKYEFANLRAWILYSSLKDHLHVVCCFWTDPYHRELMTDNASGPVQLSSSYHSILSFQPFELPIENKSVKHNKHEIFFNFSKRTFVVRCGVFF